MGKPALKKIAAIVAGTGFLNEDGDPAAFIRRHCKVGARIDLRREPQNPYDRNAIAVILVKTGWLGRRVAKIGHVKAPLAKRLAPLMDSGIEMQATVVSFFAPREKEFPRVSISIVYMPESTT